MKGVESGVCLEVTGLADRGNVGVSEGGKSGVTPRVWAWATSRLAFAREEWRLSRGEGRRGWRERRQMRREGKEETVAIRSQAGAGHPSGPAAGGGALVLRR